jgi:hypothetical protein
LVIEPVRQIVSAAIGVADPAEDMTTILMIQRAPAPPGLPILLHFWTAA